LIKAFMDELQRRFTILRADVEKRFIPPDYDLLPKKQQKKI